MRFLVDTRHFCEEPIGWREASKLGKSVYGGGLIGGEEGGEEKEEDEEEEVGKGR